MPTLEPVREPLLEFGDSDSTKKPKPPANGRNGERPNDRNGQEFPAPAIEGTISICQLVHRADGKICGTRLSVVDVRGFTDHTETLDHLRSDAHRVELLPAIGYALRTAHSRAIGALPPPRRRKAQKK